MDLKFVFYVFLSIVVTTGVAFSFYSKSQEVVAGLVFFGLIAASVVFGLRWFTASGVTAGSAASSSWPPVINYCPDFLTLYTVNNEQVCIDTIGVSQSAGINKWIDPTQTDERFLFHLFLTTSGKDRVRQLCDQAKNKRVTWEGVWDGSVCVGNEPPVPPKNAGMPTATATAPAATGSASR